MPVEGLDETANVLSFRAQYFSYFPGEVACFNDTQTQALAGKGIAGPPSAAMLTGGPLTQGQFDTLITTLQAIPDGGFAIPIDGTNRQVRGNFSGITNGADVCGVINASLTTFATATVNGSAPYRFVVTSATTGAASSISYASAPAGGANISSVLNLTAANGAVITPGARTMEPTE
jgi:hypothetical protein